VTRWQECAAVLSSPARYVEDEQMAVRFFGGESMKGLDDPRHDLLRGIWADAFRRGSIETKRDIVAEIVDEQLLPWWVANLDATVARSPRERRSS
jgi:cytochrome P450